MAKKKRKKRWSDFSPRTQTAIVLGGIAEVVVRRPAALVRGPKPLWGAALFVQPIGSPLYLLAGRRIGSA
jgi:hypothetical protein